MRNMCYLQLRLQIALLGVLLIIKHTGSRPVADIETEIVLDDLFEMGTGFYVFNTTNGQTSDDEIICPERLKGQTFCTEVTNYLEATQLNKFKTEEFEKFKSYFKDDFVQPISLASRMSEDADETYFCNSKARLVYPKVAETVESKWLMVVQHEQYKQGVLVEQCENEDAPCKFDDLLPFGVKSRCKQHFVYRSLVVLVDGVMQERMVRLPNACKCALRDMRTS
ncbi:protein spaetzle-like [Zeugodacus cucurbitae]|uniref:protein spaetzle-like n=1 Tax=Zeugodacus cucurbitae TaxID=28588 RepID=UPI0023D93D8D|nr:protein spaetzle-like [Zeugodacus cucurbitae]